jgi:hypothetical protein
MPKFRSRIREITAEQWFENGQHVDGVAHGLVDLGTAAFYVMTAHGQKAIVVDGDWIVSEPDGEHFYPVKPDIFADNYEAV